MYLVWNTQLIILEVICLLTEVGSTIISLEISFNYQNGILSSLFTNTTFKNK